MSDTQAPIDAALFTKLSGDATLAALVTGCFDAGVPDGQLFPYLTFQLLSGIDRYVFTRRAFVEQSYQIAVWDQGLDGRVAKQAMGRVDTLLTLQPLTITGMSTMAVLRDSTFSLDDLVDGVHVKQIGGLFRVIAQ